MPLRKALQRTWWKKVDSTKSLIHSWDFYKNIEILKITTTEINLIYIYEAPCTTNEKKKPHKPPPHTHIIFRYTGIFIMIYYMLDDKICFNTFYVIKIIQYILRKNELMQKLVTKRYCKNSQVIGNSVEYSQITIGQRRKHTKN